jgi:acetyltransferase
MTIHRSDWSAPDPVHLPPGPSRWRSPDGAVVTIRPTRPGDARIAQQFVRDLSPQASHFRFMGVVRELAPHMLERFVVVDQVSEVALAAVVTCGGQTRQLGECRYAVCPDVDNCEFAVAVLDTWQRRGLGERLLSELIGIARNRGLKAMIGDVLASNAAMLGLALKLGFNVRSCREEWSMKHVSLALGPTPRASGHAGIPRSRATSPH